MTNGAPSSTSGNRAIMIVLSYLWILALVPLLVEKDDAEVQWHAKHGIVLTAAEIILYIALIIVSGMLTAITMGFGCLFSFLFPLIQFAITLLHVVCIIRGLQGQRLIIPGISEYANRF